MYDKKLKEYKSNNKNMSMDTNGAMREMPKYECHKIVHALKIAKIESDGDQETRGGLKITPADDGFAPFHVAAKYAKKHDPKEGGYYVVYEDEYKSFSPAAAFEAGYKLIK